MFKPIFTCLLFCIGILCHAQPKEDEAPSKLMLALGDTKSDTNQLKLLFQLSESYGKKSLQNKATPDSSFLYLQQAIKISQDIHIAEWRYEAYKHLGKYYLTKKDSKNGIRCFMQVIDELNKVGNKKAEVAVWEELSNLIPPRDTSGLTRLNCLEKIFLLYQQIGDKEKEIKALKNIADLRMNLGQLDTAEAELLEVLRQYKAINYPYLHYTYDLLTVTNRYKGDFNKAVYYGLKTVESMEATRDTGASLTFYSRLANIYREFDEPENSVKWYRKVFQNRKYPFEDNMYMFRDAGFFARELIKLNKDKEALAFILDIANKNTPYSPYAKASLAATLAYCYHILNKDDVANKYYLNLISLTNGLKKDNEVTADANYEIGQYFFDRLQYAKASFFFQKALDVEPGINTPSTIKDIHLKLYRADSAQGNYLSAITHLLKYQTIKDSIFNESKSRQIEELQVQYETVKKEQSIKLLEQESKIQQGKLLQASYTRNWILRGTGLLFVIVVLLARNIRLKQRTNKKLKIQQIAIEEQNFTLQHLLTEKEWLLKEIHHRVKNNLQIVISLLNSQTAFMDNPYALTAIHDCRHRVQAMSLIHQKLYGSENVSSINMSVYIRELASYLSDSFDAGQRIRFAYALEPLELDVSQAIPLGLILNEGITNALKYAFPEGRSGVISISLSTTRSHHYLLRISDNGIGMPLQFNNQKPVSLGMMLMQGLSEELNGNFSIEENHGTTINIAFVQDPMVNRPHDLTASFAINN